MIESNTILKYKATGLEWIPKVPVHWEVLRIKNIATINDEALSENTKPDFPIKYIDIGNVNSDGEINEIQEFIFADSPSRARRILRKGDVIISTVRTYLKAITQISFDVENHIASTGFAVLRPKDNITSDFLNYAVKAHYFIDSIMTNSFGVSYPAINSSVLATLPILVPPKDEQDEIVQYIKAQEEKINLFIQKKQRFIELLKEQRQSIINDKLQINAKKMRLKYCVTKVGSGVTPRGGAEVYQDEGIIFLRSQNVHNDGLKLDNVSYISEEINSEMKGSEVQFNDVLINVTGASIGRCHVFDIDAPANVNQHVCIIRPVQEVINSEFLMLQLQSVKIQIIIDMVEGASREGLTNKDIKNFPLFIPPIEEQKQIVEHIKTETATIDTAIAKAEREIELIREYKEAMISEAVMGERKIN